MVSQIPNRRQAGDVHFGQILQGFAGASQSIGLPASFDALTVGAYRDLQRRQLEDVCELDAQLAELASIGSLAGFSKAGILQRLSISRRYKPSSVLEAESAWSDTYNFLVAQRAATWLLTNQQWPQQDAIRVEQLKVPRWKSAWHQMSDEQIAESIKVPNGKRLVFVDVVASDIQMAWRYVQRPFSVDIRDRLYKDGKPEALRLMYGSVAPITDLQWELYEIKQVILQALVANENRVTTVPALGIMNTITVSKNKFAHAVQSMTADTTHAALMLYLDWLLAGKLRRQTAKVIGEKHDGFFVIVEEWLVKQNIEIIRQIYKSLGIDEITAKTI